MDASFGRIWSAVRKACWKRAPRTCASAAPSVASIGDQSGARGTGAEATGGVLAISVRMGPPRSRSGRANSPAGSRQRRCSQAAYASRGSLASSSDAILASSWARSCAQRARNGSGLSMRGRGFGSPGQAPQTTGSARAVESPGASRGPAQRPVITSVGIAVRRAIASSIDRSQPSPPPAAGLVLSIGDRETGRAILPRLIASLLEEMPPACT